MGAGVAGPDEEGKGLPEGYMLVVPATDQLFFHRLSECLPEKPLERPTYVMFAVKVEAAVGKHPNLQLLLTNRRCSYVTVVCCSRRM